MKNKQKNCCSIKPSHKGRLHEALGVDGAIPLSQLMAAKDSSDPHIREMATYAVNARRWNRAKH